MKKTTFIVRLIAIILCLFSLQYGLAQAEWNLPFDGCVTGEKVSVYRDSDSSSERITRLSKDTSVTVIGVEKIGDKLW